MSTTFFQQMHQQSTLEKLKSQYEILLVLEEKAVTSICQKKKKWQTFLNLSAVLQACDSNIDKVVQTTVYMTDASKFPELNELFSEFFSKTPPTRSTPIVQLPKGLLLGIECIALAWVSSEPILSMRIL